jgi:hypothetical protein
LLPAWNPEAPTVRQQVPAGGSAVQQMRELLLQREDGDKHVLPKHQWKWLSDTIFGVTYEEVA